MKPGRKLVEPGAANGTAAELLALRRGSGGPGYSALDCAEQLLTRYGTLAGLMDQRLQDLAAVRGSGPVKAMRLAAAYELTVRIIRQLEHNP